MPFTNSSSLSSSARDSLPAISAGTRSALHDFLREIAPVLTARELVGDALPEGDAAAPVLDDGARQIHVRQVEAKVGLVVAVLAHRFLEGHARKFAGRVERLQVDAEDLVPDAEDEALDDAEDVVLVHERHLDVDLRELGLTIEAQVFVAEALHEA